MVKEYDSMAIVVCQNKVLYTIEKVGDSLRTGLPKGHIEPNENHLDCAIRECMEETGVLLNKNQVVKELDPFDYTFQNMFNDYKLTNKTIYPFIFKIDKEITPTITEENIKQCEYLDINSLIKRVTFDNIRDLLKIVKKALNL